MKRARPTCLAALASLTVLASVAWGADHEDSPSVRTDPTTDLGDVMAWMSPDAQRLNLLATVVRHAGANSRFSDAALYVFHTTSLPAFGQTPPPGGEVDVICKFDGATTQTTTCYAGGSTVSGNANTPAGIASSDGRLRVFAGLRNDAFFFNSDGFNATRGLVINAAPTLTFDAAGCPAIDSSTSQALVTQLQSGRAGAPATDNFGNANILVLALSVDKAIVTRNGPIVGVWGSTNREVVATSCVGDKDGDGQVRIQELILAVNNALGGCAPEVPAVGLQIERMGRPAINTALIGPFLDPGGGGARGALQDTYNADQHPENWVGNFAAEIASNLAIYDGLDTNCGNQLLAGAAAEAGRYDTLAAVLADDQLYVNTASGVCQMYLAVEANAVGIPNSDCGGRTPLYDTIDVSYSVLAAGVLSGIGDGIAMDSDGTASASEFPFFDEPLVLQ